MTVDLWFKRFAEAKRNGIPDHIAVLDKTHPGAVPKITRRIGKAILTFTEGKVSRQAPIITRWLKNKYGLGITIQRIQQWLLEQGLKPYHRPKQPRLLASHKQKRLKFARKYRNHDWMNTLFTDETDFPPLKHRLTRGYLGLQNHREHVWFRNLRMRALTP